MARKNKTLSNVFNQQTQEENEIITGTQKTEQENVILNSNNDSVTETEQENVTLDSNTNNINENEILNNKNGNVNENEATNVTIKSVASDFKSEFQELTKKPKVEDTHERTTFLFRKDLKKQLDRIAKKEGKGFKTRFMNKAIEVLLDEWERE